MDMYYESRAPTPILSILLPDLDYLSIFSGDYWE